MSRSLSKAELFKSFNEEKQNRPVTARQCFKQTGYSIYELANTDVDFLSVLVISHRG
ncbi:unnamed protein product [Schistosoma margrebowiei]|uniref:Uncharacterized protein n=1 Tax=Schistosoma margrebowiei TaxID=48269 RepID=A0A183M1E0_9TREM|nr:unnamed protein product [Schistosoma margrebowiei]